MRCSTCDGEGGWTDYVEIWELPYQECPVCKGTGSTGLMQWFWEHAPIEFVEWYIDFLWDRQKEEKVK